MNDQLNQSGQCPTPRMAARPIPEDMTVLRLGQYGRPSLATAGLLVQNPTLFDKPPKHSPLKWMEITGFVSAWPCRHMALSLHGCVSPFYILLMLTTNLQQW